MSSVKLKKSLNRFSRKSQQIQPSNTWTPGGTDEIMEKIHSIQMNDEQQQKQQQAEAEEEEAKRIFDECYHARRELESIFKYQQDDLCEVNSPAIQRAMELLMENPKLAAEQFEATDEVCYKFLPLSILVTSGAERVFIEQVHKLNPDAVKTPHPVLGIYPLQAACEVHAENDVIEFLACEYPDAVRKKDHKGDLILHSILSVGKEAKPRRMTVEMLVDLYPGSLKEKNAEFANPLEVAFKSGMGPKITDNLIRKMKLQDIHTFTIGEWKDFTLSAKDVSRLRADIFPKMQVKSFRCEPREYSEDGFVALMACLAKETSIKNLALAYPSLNSRRSKAFLNFLRDNTTVQHLELTRGVNMWSKGNGVDYLLQGMRLNQSIESLKVAGHFLLSSFELGFLVSRAPKRLVIENVMIENVWRSGNHAHWKASQVKELAIRNCKMSGKCLDKLLNSLSRLPHLKALTIDYSGPEDRHDARHLNGRDITRSILTLLEQNRLKALIVQGLELEVHKLSCALMTNTSLRLLHMDALQNSLEHKVECLVAAMNEENQTLEDIKFHCNYRYDQHKNLGPRDPDEPMQNRNFVYVEDPALVFYTDRNKFRRQQRRMHQKQETQIEPPVMLETEQQGTKPSFMSRIMTF